MLVTRLCGWLVVLVITVTGTGLVFGQTYPNKAIRIYTVAPGTGGDQAARLVGQGLAESFGEPVTVVNQVSVTAPGEVAKAPPDGYSLLVSGSTLWLSQFLLDHVSWDPVKDFSPITLIVTAPGILVVSSSMSVKSVKDLIALAKSRPGKLNYGAGTIGAPPHLAGELFKSMAGVNIVAVPYKGTPSAMTALISGDVQLAFPAVIAAMPFLQAGSLKALAVTSAKRSTLAPGIPTVAESGLPGFEMVSMYGMFAPAKTPEAVITRLNREIVQIIRKPEVKELFFKSGSETVGNSPEQFAEIIKADIQRMGKVIKDAGIKAESE